MASVAEHARAELAFSIVFVSVKNRSLRLYVDYRRLIAVTVRDSCPISCMEECIDYLKETKLFSSLDANSRYRTVGIYEKDADKTAFVTHNML